MGWGLRRSIKVAPGIRLNLSKSGVGVSAGVRGARISAGPRGGRLTASLPGTGVSYTQRLSGARPRRAAGVNVPGRAGARSPVLAAILSACLIGLGQVYNGQVFKGLGLFAVAAVSVAFWAVGIGLLLTGGLWLFAVVDAYRTARSS